MALSEKIKENRVRLGMTQEQLAEKLNVTPQLIYKYEQGIRIPNAYYAVSLAETFGTTVEQLVKGDDES